MPRYRLESCAHRPLSQQGKGACKYSMFPGRGSAAYETEWGPISEAHVWKETPRLRAETEAEHSRRKDDKPQGESVDKGLQRTPERVSWGRSKLQGSWGSHASERGKELQRGNLLVLQLTYPPSPSAMPIAQRGSFALQ